MSSTGDMVHRIKILAHFKKSNIRPLDSTCTIVPPIIDIPCFIIYLIILGCRRTVYYCSLGPERPRHCNKRLGNTTLPGRKSTRAQREWGCRDRSVRRIPASTPTSGSPCHIVESGSAPNSCRSRHSRILSTWKHSRMILYKKSGNISKKWHLKNIKYSEWEEVKTEDNNNQNAAERRTVRMSLNAV